MGNSKISFEEFYRLSERRMRISADIDIKSKEDNLKPLKIFFKLKEHFPNCEISIDKTHHGFHIKAVGAEIEKIPISKRVDIRESLGDDPDRIDWDRRKIANGLYFLVETLFSMKRGFDGILCIVEPVNPLALPWAPRVPAKKS